MDSEGLDPKKAKAIVIQIAIFIAVFWLVGRIFGLIGLITAISLTLGYRIVRIFWKREKIFSKLLGVLGSIVYISAIIITNLRKDWFGFWGLIAVFIGLLSYRLFHLFRRWKSLKDLMVTQLKTFEKGQLGRDLDDPYWETHKKPSWKELMTGKYVPKDKKGVIIENETRKDNSKI